MKFLNYIVVLVASVRAIIESIDPLCGTVDTFLINSAIDDAIVVATDARNQLSTFLPSAASTHDSRLGIYKALFNPGDLATIIGISHQVPPSSYKVKIYCEGKTPHIEWFQGSAESPPGWWDTKFYHNAQPGEEGALKVGSIPNIKPTGSWMKHGYTIHANFDCSNQAHIQLKQKTIDKIGLETDNREFTEIRAKGLESGVNFNNIDYFRPLSRTMLHEFFHVVGGLDMQNQPIVIDVQNPNRPGQNYGTFNDCVSQKNAPIPTVRLAECLTLLTVGLYLGDIQGLPAYWSVGVVDRVTLHPVNLPGMGNARIKRHTIRKYSRIQTGRGWTA